MSEQQSYSQTPPAAASRTSPLATTSLVAGILTWLILPLVGAIVAVVAGLIAKRDIRNSAGELTGSGMATAGLALGCAQLVLVVIPICVILILALLGPAIGNVFSDIITAI